VLQTVQREGKEKEEERNGEGSRNDAKEGRQGKGIKEAEKGNQTESERAQSHEIIRKIGGRKEGNVKK
jgi:hypothetical protein